MKWRTVCFEMFLFATCVYLQGNLRVRLATQRKFLRKFNLRSLAGPFDQGFMLNGGGLRDRLAFHPGEERNINSSRLLHATETRINPASMGHWNFYSLTS